MSRFMYEVLNFMTERSNRFCTIATSSFKLLKYKISFRFCAKWSTNLETSQYSGHHLDRIKESAIGRCPL